MNELIPEFLNQPDTLTTTVQLLLLLTVLSLAPAILVLMTCFTRIVVVLSFVRTSLATQQMPPNQVLIGLALFLTFFVMAPVFYDVNEQAIKPLRSGELTAEEAFKEGTKPMKEFMAKYTRQKDLALFMNYSQMERPESIEDIPLEGLVNLVKGQII